eukprot:TRINITY_DN7802_c0_g1_i1.p1 TRINITY_DN7802_c0_g1~~TRINITY_DN7802_c0_g1_i1.p1  ORF type:complete len:202 (-),score=29.45 TRINITY_DN7802_c0_g1_i1:38-643(-)
MAAKTKILICIFAYLFAFTYACSPMRSITSAQLRCVFPQLPSDKADIYAIHLNSQLVPTGVSNTCQWAALLGNIGTESNGLTEWTQIPCDSSDDAPYCGRGPLQITGPTNYNFCAGQGVCGCPTIYSNPSLVSYDTATGMGTAACVWATLSGRNLNQYADGTLAGFKITAELINCGTTGCTPNGWASRQAYWAAANSCFGN